MSPELTHDEIRDLLGVYALDATSEEERREVEEHLGECPRCRAEVADHRETASMLAAAGAPAPDGIWDRIAESLDGPIPIDRPPARRRTERWIKGVASAAAAALVLWLAVDVVDQRQQLQELAGSVEEANLAGAAAAALVHPDARRIQLASSEGSLSAEAVVLPNGTGYLVTDNLDPLPSARTYQLWALGEADPISAGVLGPDPDLSAFSVSPELTGLAITQETAGGVTASKNAPMLVGDVMVA